MDKDRVRDWLLLIYTVPSQPSRLRATVWRELKKAGAVYLRDGVAILPQRDETLAVFQAIAGRIGAFGGQATLVEGARLGAERAEAVITQLQAARAEEYAEIRREAEHFLAHAARERAHRAFTFAELEELEEDLGKLKHWVAQVRTRDYCETADGGFIEELLDRCEAAVSSLLEEAYGNDKETRS